MNSTNIKVISEEIQRLKDQVHSIDVEVPDPSQATDGQILSIDDGKYVISDPEKELPATTEAATGDVLGLVGEAKTPGWITPFTPLDYSTTEQDTGVKWIDGKNIYRKIISEPADDQKTSPVSLSYDLTALNIETMVFMIGNSRNQSTTGLLTSDISNYASANYITNTRYLNFSKTLNHTAFFSNGYFGGSDIIIYYTKTTATREPDLETTSTKKKTTKKGD